MVVVASILIESAINMAAFDRTCMHTRKQLDDCGRRYIHRYELDVQTPTARYNTTPFVSRIFLLLVILGETVSHDICTIDWGPTYCTHAQKESVR